MAQTESTAQAQHDIRLKRIFDNIALKETDRVPFTYSTRFWAAKYAGISFKEQMYDVEKAADATRRAIEFLDPDGMQASLYSYGPAMEAMEYRPMAWPGHGCADNVSFQYLDKEFMSADEYDEYLFDPTRFYLTKYMQRIAGAFEGIETILDFASASEWRLITGIGKFGDPAFRAAMEKLMDIGEQMSASSARNVELTNEIVALGYPNMGGGFCKAPFDHIADFLRGSKSCMLDMFRKRDKLLEVVDKTQQLLVRGVVEETRRSNTPFVFIPLHWGLDGFMSPEQFQTFYWPGLKKTILYFIEHDLIPVVLWEGDCTSRLEFIGDIPAGKAVYWFERTDLVRAKEVLGDTVCLRGNVPASLLVTATPDDVDAYCKNIIQKVGRGGGLILDGSASIPDEAPIENVKAMADSVKKYAF